MDDLKEKIGQRYKILEQEIDRKFRNEKDGNQVLTPAFKTAPYEYSIPQ
jgi:hypothetical protein